MVVRLPRAITNDLDADENEHGAETSAHGKPVEAPKCRRLNHN